MRLRQFTREEIQVIKALFGETKMSLPEPGGFRDLDLVVQATAYGDLKTSLLDPGGLRNAVVHGAIRDGSCETLLSSNAVGRWWQEVTVVEPLVPPTGPIDVRGASPGDDDSQVITPGTGVITISAGVPLAVESTVRPVAPPAPPGLWLDSIAFCIPKSIREPFLGDLLEDMADMAAKGYSRTAVTRRVIAQVLLSLSLRVLEFIRRG